MRFVGRCFRGHDPSWSFLPISGQGAATTGGRFNRRGEPCLYLSLDVMTAIMESMQGFSGRVHRLTMCEYDVYCDSIADLRDDAVRAGLGLSPDDLGDSWLLDMRAGRDAPSWRAVDQLKEAGKNGILVTSFMPGATSANINLVLWRWGPDLPCRVIVDDPTGRLDESRPT